MSEESLRVDDASDDRAGSAWGLLASLTALNVLAYVDRQLLVALAPLLIEGGTGSPVNPIAVL